MYQTLLILGILCLLGGVVGGGLKAFGVEIPALKRGWQYIALFAIGVSLIVWGWQQWPVGPASGIELSGEPENSYNDGCPARLDFDGTIRLKSGMGDVKYFWIIEAVDRRNTPVELTGSGLIAHFDGPDAQHIRDSATIRQSLYGTIEWRVYEPFTVASEPMEISITCTS
jgi:hypothetical protein